MRHWLIFLLMLVGLTACGFQPRGVMPLAPPLHHLYLQTADPYGQLSRNIKQYLKASNVQLANSALTAETVLDIQKEETTQQLLSVGGTQQTRQYNLILTVQFQVTDPKGIVLIPSQAVSESCTIPIQANQILAGSNEANTLFQRMRQAIVFDIMIRLSSTDASNLLMKKR